jgi:hypothetical protein
LNRRLFVVYRPTDFAVLECRAASAAATVALQRISESDEDEPASLAASDKDSDEELGEPESDPVISSSITS